MLWYEIKHRARKLWFAIPFVAGLILLAIYIVMAVTYRGSDGTPLFIILPATIGVLFGTAGFVWALTPWASQSDRCPHCGYNLTGLRDADRCPECGGDPRKEPDRSIAVALLLQTPGTLLLILGCWALILAFYYWVMLRAGALGAV